MFVVKFKPQPILAVLWEGNNFEEVCQLFPSALKKELNNEILISNDTGDDIIVPVSWFIVKYGSKPIVFSSRDFFDIFTDYFNPHEHYNDFSTEEEKEVEDSRPDPEFIQFM